MSETVNTNNTVIADEINCMVKKNPIMELAIKTLKTNVEKNECTVKIPVSLEDAKKNNIKTLVSEIMSKVIFINDSNSTGYPLAKAAEYKDGILSIEFSKDIIPYILNL